MTDLTKIAAKFRDAFTYDPGHSDLDRDQPITITVSLGDWRDLDYALNAAPQGQVVEGAASPAQPAVAAPHGPDDDTPRLDWLDGPDRHVMRWPDETVISSPCTHKAVSFYINGKYTIALGNTTREAIDKAMAIYRRNATLSQPSEER